MEFVSTKLRSNYMSNHIQLHVAQPAGNKPQLFSFDQVHGPPTTQHALFTATALPLVARFVEGFNCTILAYGQTSSGKTHTMTGADLVPSSKHLYSYRVPLKPAV
ncbi:P-loop containing nucleoside triphosphate hydrolase protein [Mycena sp. CBHHK59/15]|nr:P-loop containing nucleoside triphosphate hydrolase protein [Mycena sp. CBHHK59/15]